MKSAVVAFIAFLALSCTTGTAQKKISDFSIVYDYRSFDKKSDGSGGNSGTYSISVKGTMSRAEMTSQTFSSVVICNSAIGDAVILKEVSGQKILIRVSPTNWHQMNAIYDGLVFTNSAETKTIAGYKCLKAMATMPDSSVCSVYYTTDLSVENKEYLPRFKNLGGLPLEYELTKGGITLRYVLSKINLNPVPESKFDIPKKGYREMTFDESRKINVGG